MNLLPTNCEQELLESGSNITFSLLFQAPQQFKVNTEKHQEGNGDPLGSATSLKSSTTANKGERTTLESRVLLTPRDLCQADDTAISNCKNHLPLLLIFNIKKLENYMKESPKATEHPPMNCSTCSRTANNRTAIYWEEPTTTGERDTAGEDKRGQHRLWEAVLGQSLK